MIGDLVEQAERLTLEEAQHRALFSPHGLKRANEQKLRDLVTAELKRELCVRETRQ